MQMIRSGDNRKTQLLSQLDQKIFFSACTHSCPTHLVLHLQPIFFTSHRLLHLQLRPFTSDPLLHLPLLQLLPLLPHFLQLPLVLPLLLLPLLLLPLLLLPYYYCLTTTAFTTIASTTAFTSTTSVSF